MLWERGYVNIGELDMYSGEGKKIQKDESGKVRLEFEQHVLCTLMGRCLDFLN